MVNPKKEPGIEPQKEHKKEKINEHGLRDRWADRMRSTLIRMSRGAQNFWTSLPRPHREEPRANEKRNKK